MRTLFGMVILLLAVAVGLGFYQGWFLFSTTNAAQRPSVAITVDKNIIRADEGKAKQKVEEFGKKAKEKIDDSAGRAKESERQPLH